MAKETVSNEEKKGKVHKPEQQQEPEKGHDGGVSSEAPLVSLQQQVGNQAVQRLLAQRSEAGPAELDDETAKRINQERGGGQPLEDGVQEQMGDATGQDVSDVRVHTSPESDDLSHQLGAKAFTTGKDMFFREGAYEPHTSDGQELIAHELTHVAQQGSGRVSGAGGRMTVNEPGDSFEQEAESAAKTVTSPGAEASVQRQEEEDKIQGQEMEKEEETAAQKQDEEPEQEEE